MRTVFADTHYWIAVVVDSDEWHERAIKVSESLKSAIIQTTDEVLVEFLNYFAQRGPGSRATAVKMAEAIMSNPNVHVVPQTRDSFSAGLNLYQQRIDKEYSLTDCISLSVMNKTAINEVLTHDRHFSQEGMTLLL